MERAFRSVEDIGIEPDFSGRVQETMDFGDLENRGPGGTGPDIARYRKACEAITWGRSAPDWSAT